jgi:hypothetical protein
VSAIALEQARRGGLANPCVLRRLPAGHSRRVLVGFAIGWRCSFEGRLPQAFAAIRRRREMPISFSMIVMSSQLVVAVADGVPNFDIARSCKLDVAATTGLTVDQSMKSCVNDEQKAKRQLASQWSKFPAPSRASCTSQESVGGTPSYVSLLTCLQMGQWAR